MGQFIEIAKSKINESEDATEKFRSLIYMHFFQLSQDPNLAIVTQLELRQSNAELRRQINEVLKKYLHLIDEVIHCGMEQGTFRRDLDPVLVRQMIFGTLDECVTNWLLKERKFDLVSSVDPVFKVFMNGLKREEK